MQGNADEPSEDTILAEDVEDVSKVDILPELFETNTLETGENDITVLEESTIVAPAPVLTTDAPEPGSECLH